MSAALRPGDFAVTATYGNWHDRLAAWAIRYGTESPYNHAFLYIGDGQIIEAAPGGARVNSVDAYPHAAWSSGRLGINNPNTQERDRIVAAAHQMLGRPYGWLDILAISLAQKRLGARVSSKTWWVKRISDTDTLICSQLVDLAYDAGGIELFHDGRIAGLVSPGDLANVLQPYVSLTAVGS